VVKNGAAGVVDELRHLWRRCDSRTVLAQPPERLPVPWRSVRTTAATTRDATSDERRGRPEEHWVNTPDDSNSKAGDVTWVRDGDLVRDEATCIDAGLPAATVIRSS
jgi:hypothetical protein